MSTAYFTHPACLKHQMGDTHPESPARLAAINDGLIAARIMELLQHHSPHQATKQQLLRVHSREHVETIHANAPANGMFAIDPDTYMNSYTLDAALYAAGAVVNASDLVFSGEATNAFCAVRPPGHHAERDRAMGFCFFNNVAVGVAHVLENYNLKRVAIVDFDVHHGNGTENIFENESRVLLCSSFQYPFYPYSGDSSLSGHLINTHLPAGTSSEGFRAAITREWLPELREFKPEMIFISAGFDAHKLDFLAQLNLIEEDYYWITQQIMDIARDYSGNRIVSSLEGGYHLNALAQSVVSHIKALLSI